MAAILGLACILGAIGQKLRQPLIIMFLITGIIAGPSVLGIISSHNEIALFAHIGIALLLFIVGMRLDISLIRTLGPVAVATGIGQIVFTSAIGFLIAMLLGMDALSAAYLSVALTFSSTIIIVKLLSDKKEIESLHGRIAVGFLIVQDIAAILALVALTTFGAGLPDDASPFLTITLMVVKATALLGGTALATRFLFPWLLPRLASSQEMLLLFAIAWAVALGAVSELLGFSKEVGAFLAGVAIASTDYRDAIGARLTGLRDFLLLFFFIDLGSRLEWGTVGAQVPAAILFSVFVLIGNPIIVLIIMGYMGFRRRTGFMAGLTVAQISEFSLIVAALGVTLGHISPETMGLITLVGVITICLSTYMILYAAQLYRVLSGPLKIFERKTPTQEAAFDNEEAEQTYDVVLVGLGDYGGVIAQHLLERGKTLLGVDFDPRVLETWRARGVRAFYGDMADPEFHEFIPLRRTRWVVSSIRGVEMNTTLFNLLKQRNYEGRIALTAASAEEAHIYETMGANVVLQPLSDAAEQAVDALTSTMELLPLGIEWPIEFHEVRLKAISAHAGRKIVDIGLPKSAGVSILAVSRGGRVYYEPKPDFRLYPGDRLVIMGPPNTIEEAENALNELAAPEEDSEQRFDAAEVLVSPDSTLVGKTLAEIQFREHYAATVVGISRNQQQIFPGPAEQLQARDVLVVVGLEGAITAFKRQPWL